MKKVFSWILVIALVFSLSSTCFAVWNEAPELDLTAMNDNGTVTVVLATKQATELSALNFNLNFSDAQVTLKSTQKMLEKGSGFYTAVDEGGEQKEDKATISIGTGKVSFSIALSSNTSFAAGTTLFSASFTVNDSVEGKINFTIGGLSAGKAGAGSYNYTAQQMPSAYISIPLSSLSLTGSVTAPTKGSTDASSVTADSVDATVTWSPALNNGKFAANTAYTATVTLTPKTGYTFADTMTVTGLDDYTFAKQTDGSYTASHTYEATADKAVTALEVTTAPAKTVYNHGDAFDQTGMVVKATYDEGTVDENFTGYTVTYANGGTYLKKGETSVTLKAGDKTVDVAGLTVSAKELTITGLTATNRTYDGTTAVILTGGTLSGAVTGETVSATMPTSGSVADGNVGTGKAVTVTKPELTGADAENYTLADINGITVDISKATPAAADFVFTAPTDLTYDGTAKSATVAVKSGIEGMGEITVKYNPDGHTAYGTYKVSISVAEGTNYTAAELSDDTWTFTIVKAAATFTTTPAAKTGLTYTGAAQELITAGTTSDGTVQYKLSTATDYSATIPTATDAGTYTVDYKIAPDDNHSEATGSVEVTIGKADYDMSGVSFENADKTYTGEEQGLTVTGTLPTGADGKAVTVTYSEGQTNVGEKEITATFATESTNYNVPAAKTATLTVTAKAITPTVSVEDGGTYDGTEKKPAVTVKDGDKELTKDTDYTVAYTDNTDAGTAKATISPVTNGNYTFTATDKDFTIAKATYSGAVTGTVAFYYGTAITDGSFALTSLTGLPTTGWTEAKFTGTPTSTGAVLTAAPSVAADGANIGYQYDGTKTSGLSDTVTATISSKNYQDITATVTFSTVDITFTVGTDAATADNSITVNSDKLIYGNKWSSIVSKATNFTASVNSDSTNTQGNFKLYVGDDAMDSTAVPAVGTYNVKVLFTGNIGDKTYTNVKVAEKSVTIGKAALKITAKNKTISFGQEAANNGAAYQGLVNGDTSDVVAGLTYSYGEYTVGSAVGTYPISLSGATADNYDITYGDNGVLTVTKASITPVITLTLPTDGYTYDGSEKKPTVTVKASTADDAATLAESDYTVEYSNNVNATTGSSIAKVTVKAAGNGNYTFTNAVKTFAIAKKSVTVTWPTTTAFYYTGKALTAVQPTLNGVIDADTENVTVSVSGDTQTAVGTYKAKAALAGTKAGNYTIQADSETWEYTISYALTEVTATPDTVTATVDNSTLKIKLSGYKTDDAACTLTGGSGVYDAAAKTFTVGGVTYTVEDNTFVKDSKVNVLPEETKVDFSNADETITDDVKNALSNSATKADGLNEAAAAVIQTAQNTMPEGTASVDVQMSMKLEPISFAEMNGSKVLKLEITPVMTVTYKDSEGNTIGTPTEKTISNSNIQSAVTVSIKLPDGMPTENLFAKHNLGNGKYEWLKVTVADGVASWQQSSFSEVELVQNSNAADVTYTFNNQGQQQVSYTAAAIDTALPTDTKSGSTFSGWKFAYDGGTVPGTYKTMSEDLLEALNGKSGLIATPSFTTSSTHSNSSSTSTDAVETYSITCTAGVKASKTTAVAGTKITLTVSADGILGVKDAKGNTITVTNNTFTMPASNVTVTLNPAESASLYDGYTDLADGAWYQTGIDYCLENGLMNGVSATAFAPNATTTRAMIWTILARESGVDTTTGATWYEAGQKWAMENGISDGTNPTGSITREQLAAMLYRLAQSKGEGFTGAWAFLLDYPDASSVSSWADEAMHWCVMKGIINGKDGKLVPAGFATRAEVATMMQRFLTLEK